jgi:hypothetical protein
MNKRVSAISGIAVADAGDDDNDENENEEAYETSEVTRKRHLYVSTKECGFSGEVLESS